MRAIDCVDEYLESAFMSAPNKPCAGEIDWNVYRVRIISPGKSRIMAKGTIYENTDPDTGIEFLNPC